MRLFFAFLILACLAQASLATSKPNVIYIMADDAGLRDSGPYGGEVVPTPNVDRLAKEGMLVRFSAESLMPLPTFCPVMRAPVLA